MGEAALRWPGAVSTCRWVRWCRSHLQSGRNCAPRWLRSGRHLRPEFFPTRVLAIKPRFRVAGGRIPSPPGRITLAACGNQACVAARSMPDCLPFLRAGGREVGRCFSDEVFSAGGGGMRSFSAIRDRSARKNNFIERLSNGLRAETAAGPEACCLAAPCFLPFGLQPSQFPEIHLRLAPMSDGCSAVQVDRPSCFLRVRTPPTSTMISWNKPSPTWPRARRHLPRPALS